MRTKKGMKREKTIILYKIEFIYEKSILTRFAAIFEIKIGYAADDYSLSNFISYEVFSFTP